MSYKYGPFYNIPPQLHTDRAKMSDLSDSCKSYGWWRHLLILDVNHFTSSEPLHETTGKSVQEKLLSNSCTLNFNCGFPKPRVTFEKFSHGVNSLLVLWVRYGKSWCGMAMDQQGLCLALLSFNEGEQDRRCSCSSPQQVLFVSFSQRVQSLLLVASERNFVICLICLKDTIREEYLYLCSTKGNWTLIENENWTANTTELLYSSLT